MKRSPPYLSPRQLEIAADCLRVLGHTRRLRIVELLLRSEYTVGELAQKCKIPSHMASEHLKLLERCGFLRRIRVGRSVYYRVCHECVGELLSVMRKRFRKKTRGRSL